MHIKIIKTNYRELLFICHSSVVEWYGAQGCSNVLIISYHEKSSKEYRVTDWLRVAESLFGTKSNYDNFFRI